MERQLEKAERLSAQGKTGGRRCPRVRNPLNAISMASQRLKREPVPRGGRARRDEFQVQTGVIRDEKYAGLNGIIEEFLTFSRIRRLENTRLSGIGGSPEDRQPDPGGGR